MTCLFVFFRENDETIRTKNDADELEPDMSGTSGNEFGSTPQESQNLVVEPSGSGELADGKASGPHGVAKHADADADAEELVLEMSEASASSSSARCSPGWIAVSAIAILLMIINNLHV
jgi:hypothetical protein